MGSGSTRALPAINRPRFIGVEIDATHLRDRPPRINDALGVGGLFGPAPAAAPAELFA
jgi:hypothetical protein